MPSLTRTKSIAELISASEAHSGRLRRHLGLWSLVALGIGSVIGAGIFTLTGTAAAGLQFDFQSIYKAPVLDLLMHGSHALGVTGRPGAGPGISLSFLLVAIACGFAALCYAELASMIPVAGSAYTYAYATMGEIFAWIIGWDLILEYAVSNMAVAVGFSAYLNDLLENVTGFRLPESLSNPVFIEDKPTGAIFNLPAFVLIMVLTWILVRGVRESARANNWMVLIKIAAILIFVFGAARAVNTANWHPFLPNGFSGVLTGGAIVFHLHRLRFGLDGSRGMQRSAAQHAAGDSDHAGGLRDSVRRGRAGADRHRPLGHAQQRRAGGERAQDAGIQPSPAGGDDRRAAGDDFVAAGIPSTGRRASGSPCRATGCYPDCSRGCIRNTKRRTSAPGSRESWSEFPRGFWISARWAI